MVEDSKYPESKQTMGGRRPPPQKRQSFLSASSSSEMEYYSLSLRSTKKTCNFVLPNRGRWSATPACRNRRRLGRAHRSSTSPSTCSQTCPAAAPMRCEAQRRRPLLFRPTARRTRQSACRDSSPCCHHGRAMRRSHRNFPEKGRSDPSACDSWRKPDWSGVLPCVPASTTPCLHAADSHSKAAHLPEAREVERRAGSPESICLERPAMCDPYAT